MLARDRDYTTIFLAARTKYCFVYCFYVNALICLRNEKRIGQTVECELKLLFNYGEHFRKWLRKFFFSFFLDLSSCVSKKFFEREIFALGDRMPNYTEQKKIVSNYSYVYTEWQALIIIKALNWTQYVYSTHKRHSFGSTERKKHNWKNNRKKEKTACKTDLFKKILFH